MNALPKNITDFLINNKVINIACTNGQDVWAANCFYALHETDGILIILTKRSTRHGEMMQHHPHIAGTITAQPDGILDIAGIQLTARAELLEDTDPRRSHYRTHYTQRHPAAKLMESDVWLLHLHTIKYTDNKLVFARKTLWQREDTQ